MNTLGEVAQNPDGTFRGKDAIRWIFEAVTGKPMSDTEAAAIIEEAQRRAAAKRASAS